MSMNSRASSMNRAPVLSMHENIPKYSLPSFIKTRTHLSPTFYDSSCTFGFYDKYIFGSIVNF